MYMYIYIYIYMYIYILIMSLDKASDSFKEKGIHWKHNSTKCTGFGKSLFY